MQIILLKQSSEQLEEKAGAKCFMQLEELLHAL